MNEKNEITIFYRHFRQSKTSHALGLETDLDVLKWRLNECSFIAMLVTSPTNDRLVGGAMRMTWLKDAHAWLYRQLTAKQIEGVMRAEPALVSLQIGIVNPCDNG